MDGLVLFHVVTAGTALLSGFTAVNLQRKAPLHRIAGKAYLLSWLGFAASAYLIGARRPEISPFEVITTIGLFFTLMAYWAVLNRRKLGPRWIGLHYNNMLSSLAFVCIATLNQILFRMFDVPQWSFWVLVALPFFVLPIYGRKLNRRYFAKGTS
ncbi:DUF2306 domain-containing protein [Deinococcus cellulosilyticus]|uniref:DUF2306 domain-containing protein n=1 Tax=Deinococcus cellulosilyticus (strain DSM 18568 / NBRC 106333 / KACC 11606 / 5516J-15) TaxID=1223518 RepID=A0A511N418_DEIC1|nr:DUF2306 domain-containing protein [Deinococcus cellulosilyticus]GEM47624.1 hypothetical protein DC3_32590 [Deinococcus cellulosilyticus NBRC 106333 = KACC 11606]